MLHPTLAKCCDFHLKWKSEECNRHESGSRRLTDTQKEEDHLDIIKNIEGRLEDVSNTMEGKLAWVESNNKEMKGDIEEMKGDIEEVKVDLLEMKSEVKEMKDDMKDIKALLTELVGRNALIPTSSDRRD